MGERLDLGCELMISYGFLGLQGIKSVENAVLGDAIARNKSRYTVCYPSTSDTLWSVSKKYNASVEVTARSNGMDVNAESDAVGLTDGVKYMIV